MHLFGLVDKGIPLILLDLPKLRSFLCPLARIMGIGLAMPPVSNNHVEDGLEILAVVSVVKGCCVGGAKVDRLVSKRMCCGCGERKVDVKKKCDIFEGGQWCVVVVVYHM